MRLPDSFHINLPPFNSNEPVVALTEVVRDPQVCLTSCNQTVLTVHHVTLTETSLEERKCVSSHFQIPTSFCTSQFNPVHLEFNVISESGHGCFECLTDLFFRCAVSSYAN